MEGGFRADVERAGRLVEEQQARPVQQNARQDELLLLPAGQDLVPAFSVAAGFA
jgi:hypothetical protein